jgi:CBS domain-containing protein
MSSPVTTLDGHETVSSVFSRLEAQPDHFHAYPVTDGDGRMVGVCTFNDLKRALSAGKGAAPVRAIARKQIETVLAQQTLDAALVKMGKRGVSQLPVVGGQDEGKPVGMITMQDIARKLAAQSEDSVVA